MTITAERIDHAIKRIGAEGPDGRKLAGYLQQKAEGYLGCDAHPGELPSLLAGHTPDAFHIICASCIPVDARGAVTFLGHEVG